MLKLVGNTLPRAHKGVRPWIVPGTSGFEARRITQQYVYSYLYKYMHCCDCPTTGLFRLRSATQQATREGCKFRSDTWLSMNS